MHDTIALSMKEVYGYDIGGKRRHLAHKTVKTTWFQTKEYTSSR